MGRWGRGRKEERREEGRGKGGLSSSMTRGEGGSVSES